MSISRGRFQTKQVSGKTLAIFDGRCVVLQGIPVTTLHNANKAMFVFHELCCANKTITGDQDGV